MRLLSTALLAAGLASLAACGGGGAANNNAAPVENGSNEVLPDEVNLSDPNSVAPVDVNGPGTVDLNTAAPTDAAAPTNNTVAP